MDNPGFDLLLVGGGLQNALISLAVLHHRPNSRIALIERDGRLGGNHTWSFQTGAVEKDDWPFVEPLLEARWPRHRVIFPGHERNLEQGYASILSDRLDEVLRQLFADRPQCELVTGVAAQEISAHDVRLSDDRRLQAKLVVDARGPDHLAMRGAAGYQKFLGLELRLEQKNPIAEPWLMDARVPQSDGFRFFYVLPFDERRVLVEDTYYSDSPDLDVPTLRNEVLEYARSHGMQTAGIEREEAGVLPIPVETLPAQSVESPLLAGYQGGWFHPTTGYSFPIALRLARHLATRAPNAVFDTEYERLVREHQRQTRFCLLLNRMMFRAFEPKDRFSPLSRFYRLPDATILRFYALNTTALDRARVVVGRPPRGFSVRRFLTGGRA